MEVGRFVVYPFLNGLYNYSEAGEGGGGGGADIGGFSALAEFLDLLLSCHVMQVFVL